MPRPVKDGSLRVGDRTVQVSSVGKPFFPDAGLTKGDLLAYYRDVAEVMLPHVAGRPLNLQRFPNGVHGKGFWQQGAADHFPDWVRTVTVERRGRGGTVDHVVCEDAATIVYLANLATVTFHAWTSTVDQLARPDLVDRKSTRLNSSHQIISYAVFCLKKKKKKRTKAQIRKTKKEIRKRKTS